MNSKNIVMKPEILDTFDEKEFSAFLSEKEIIIWEGKPNYTNRLKSIAQNAKWHDWFSAIVAVIAFLYFGLKIGLVGLGLFLASRLITKIFVLVFILVVSYPRFSVFKKRKESHYVITNQKIIFQLWNRFSIKTYSIRFEEMNNIILTEETKNNGVIFISLKKPSLTEFKTYNLRNGEPRHQPTLEMIEDVEEVGKYITQGIQGKLQ